MHFIDGGTFMPNKPSPYIQFIEYENENVRLRFQEYVYSDKIFLASEHYYYGVLQFSEDGKVQLNQSGSLRAFNNLSKRDMVMGPYWSLEVL